MTMLTQSKATIFLSGERAEQQSEIYRSYGTLVAEEKNPFGSLVSLDDVTLAPGKSCMIDASAGLDYIIFPVVGTVYFESGRANNLVNPGQSLFICPEKNHDLIITNPYGDELVNFLQIGFNRGLEKTKPSTQIHSFDIDNNKNRMLPVGDITANSFRRISIGKFDGRAETIYQLATPQNGVFVFVISGAFEVQYRLLEGRDGLALWDMKEMELEALSNEAIILAVELPVSAFHSLNNS